MGLESAVSQIVDISQRTSSFLSTTGGPDKHVKATVGEYAANLVFLKAHEAWKILVEELEA